MSLTLPRSSDVTDKEVVLVAGEAGFVASHLCERLVEQDGDVLFVENFFTRRKDSIAHLPHEPRFELMRCDVTTHYVEVDESTSSIRAGTAGSRFRLRALFSA